jgi:hypothetical protein
MAGTRQCDEARAHPAHVSLFSLTRKGLVRRNIYNRTIVRFFCSMDGFAFFVEKRKSSNDMVIKTPEGGQAWANRLLPL